MTCKIIVDPLPSGDRVAVLRSGQLVSYFEAPASRAAPVPGSIAVVRADRVFPERQMVACTLGDHKASLRWAGKTLPQSGERLLVTVAAEPREGKPLQLRRGAVIEDTFMIIETGRSGLHVSRRLEATGFSVPEDLERLCSSFRLTLRKPAVSCDSAFLLSRAEALVRQAQDILDLAKEQDGILRQGPAPVAVAEMAFPDADIITDEDGTLWQQADIDMMLEEALLPRVELDQGAVLHISTPPGAAVFDGDSGASFLPPAELAKAMVTPVADAMMLRRISGPVVIDFPRLEKHDAGKVDAMMKGAVEDDPLRPVCHGFTAGGLYTLTRPWRWQPLADMLKPSPWRQALAALRLGQKAVFRAERGVVLLPIAAMHWLENNQQSDLNTVMKDLASKVEFRSDECVVDPVFEPAEKKG